LPGGLHVPPARQVDDRDRLVRLDRDLGLVGPVVPGRLQLAAFGVYADSRLVSRLPVQCLLVGVRRLFQFSGQLLVQLPRVREFVGLGPVGRPGEVEWAVVTWTLGLVLGRLVAAAGSPVDRHASQRYTL
jgi:hypothetical protein